RSEGGAREARQARQDDGPQGRQGGEGRRGQQGQVAGQACGQEFSRARPGHLGGLPRPDRRQSGRATPRGARLVVLRVPACMSAVSRLMAAARTFTACAAVALYVLLVGPPAMAWTLLTKRPKPMYTAGWLGVRLGFLLTGIRVRIEGAEHM